MTASIQQHDYHTTANAYSNVTDSVHQHDLQCGFLTCLYKKESKRIEKEKIGKQRKRTPAQHPHHITYDHHLLCASFFQSLPLWLFQVLSVFPFRFPTGGLSIFSSALTHKISSRTVTGNLLRLCTRTSEIGRSVALTSQQGKTTATRENNTRAAFREMDH